MNKMDYIMTGLSAASASVGICYIHQDALAIGGAFVTLGLYMLTMIIITNVKGD